MNSQAALRPIAQDRFNLALKAVMEMALEDCSGGVVCRDFLLSLYNGKAYPFDLSSLRKLDARLYDACLDIMSVDCRPSRSQEIHRWWSNGDELFEALQCNRDKQDRISRRRR